MLEDVPRARNMLTSLSETLRYSLTKSNVDAIALEDELDMVRNFIAISKIQGTRGDGLFIYTSDKQSYIHYQADANSPNSLPSNQLYTLYFDQQGSPWVTSSDGGVAKYEGITKGFVTVPLPIATITDMLQDSEGNYWLTSSRDGLIRLTAEGEITHFSLHTSHPIPKKHLFSIVADNNHILWIASNEGLLRFNTQDFSSRLLTTTDGLIDNTIYLLFADQRRHLWLGTTKGLTQLDPDTLQTTNYTDIDGIQDNEFNFGAAALGSNKIGRAHV